MNEKKETYKEDTESKIVVAAQEVFLERGYTSTRMREIADRANINKGLLHYYFKTKDKLFATVFSLVFPKIFNKVNKILDSDMPLFDKIEKFVHTYIGLISKNPTLPRIVINELNRNPDLFINKINLQKTKPHVNSLANQLVSEAQAGTIREVNPKHFIINMISACLFPFIGKPMFQIILDINEKNYQQMIYEKKNDVTDLLINSLRIKNVELRM